MVLVIGLNLLVKPLYIFGIDRTVQNLVGPEPYGLYFALFNLAYLLQIINDFGIQNFNHSVFSKHPHLIRKYLPRILIAKCLLSLAFLFSLMIVGLALGYALELLPLLAVIGCNQVFVSFIAYCRINLSASGFYKLDSLLSVLDKSLMILLMGYLIWFASWTSDSVFHIEWFVFAQTITLILTAMIAWLVLKRKVQIRFNLLRPNLPFIKWVLVQSWPYALVLLLMTLYTRIDGVMIERLLPTGAVEAGIYAASYRILDAVNMIGVLFAGLLLPMFAKLLKKKLPVHDLVNTSFSILWVVSVTVSVLCIHYGVEIISLLYTGASMYWGQVFQILMPSYTAISMAYIFGTLLTAHESIRQMNYVFIAGCVANVIMNFVFISWWHAWGAALATLITQSLVVVGLFVLTKRRIHVKLAKSNILRAALFLMLTLVAARLSYAIPLPWLAQASVFCLCAFLIGLLCRLLPVIRFIHLSQADEANELLTN